ncbi:MAG TPA: glycosyl hydrolase-related protein [Vicinamibacteria bacterium]|nr:glycosyl hydrolase-related protein [Vicinamibacteria bacterium]
MPAPPLEVHVVSHTHWDRERRLTREQFRLRLVELIDGVLDLMDADPRFQSFHLDGQTIVLDDYLEVRPEQAERLRRRIAERRVLVGPWYVMPDEFLVSGEALVRNLALGHRQAARFGSAMSVGYLPDPYGHVAQMPQILAHFGVQSAVLWRGFDGARAEYWWEAPDGTRALLLHLPPEGYTNAARLPLLSAEEMRARSAAVIAREGARSAVGQVLLMAGADHVEPHPALTGFVARLADEPGVRARLSSLPAYVDAVRGALKARGAGNGLETVRGELRGGEGYAPLMPGVLSTRVYLKQANARVEGELERWAEPVSAMAWLGGSGYPGGLLGNAWKTLLQNQPHDSIAGAGADAVHDENVVGFARARQAAEGITERALAALGRQVEAPTAGALRLIAVNGAAEAFTGVVDGVVELPFESAEPGRTVGRELLDQPMPLVSRSAAITAVTDGDGRPVSFQLLSVEEGLAHLTSRYETPWPVRVRRMHLALWAEEVPAGGYTSFDVHLSEAAATPFVPRPAGAVSAGDRWLENAWLRVDAGDDGTLVVRDKRTGMVYRRCGELEDTGDVGDAYAYCPPAEDLRVAGTQARPVAVRLLASGPLRAMLGIELELPVPAQASADGRARSDERVGLPVSLRVGLDAGSGRVSWAAAVDNRARDHRLRVLFAAGAAVVATVRADSAFAVVERPAWRAPVEAPRLEATVSTAPMQSLVEAGDLSCGASVLADGLAEYEIVPGDGARIAVTLLRCVGALSREGLATRPAGHAGPALPTPGAQCPGRHEFRLAFEPRAAPPSAAALLRSARSWLHPPRLAPAAAGGRWPARLSLISVTSEGPAGGAAVVSALKKTDDRESLLLRLFNPGGEEVRVRVRCALPIARAFAVDFLERTQQEIPAAQGQVSLALPGGRVQTVELVPDRGGR